MQGSKLSRIAEAKQAVDLMEMIGRSVALAGGRRFKHGPCPFCQGKSRAAFWVDGLHQKFGCFASDDHKGDVFDWLRLTQSLELEEAIDQILGRASLDRLASAVAPFRPKPRPVADDGGFRVRAAMRIWSESLPADGTAVETYLRARGISIAIPKSLRFHPGLEYTAMRVMSEDGREVLRAGPTFPAMVALVVDAHRRVRGVHRTYLRHDGTAKADVETPKRMLGEISGGFVPLGAFTPESEMAEGIESALSVLEDRGRGAAACLALNNWSAALPAVVTTLTLCIDMDEAARLMSAAEKRLRARQGRRIGDPEKEIAKAVEAHAGRGVTVKVARPPLGMDFNDLARELKAGRDPRPIDRGCEIARRYGAAA